MTQTRPVTVFIKGTLVRRLNLKTQKAHQQVDGAAVRERNSGFLPVASIGGLADGRL